MEAGREMKEVKEKRWGWERKGGGKELKGMEEIRRKGGDGERRRCFRGNISFQFTRGKVGKIKAGIKRR